MVAELITDEVGVIEWRLHLSKRSVGRPPIRWTDDILKDAGSECKKIAEDQAQWRM